MLLSIILKVKSSRAEFHAHPLPLNPLLFLLCLMQGYEWTVWL